MPQNLKKAIIYWFVAYWIVTLLAIGLTILFAVLYNPPRPEGIGSDSQPGACLPDDDPISSPA